MNKRLLLAFGYVGSYKGFEILENLELPDGWALVSKQNKHERGIEKTVRLEKDANGNMIITMNNEYLSDEMLSKLFFACDAIILPYKVVSISGVLFDALAHGLPFVASDLQFFQEFARLGLGITCAHDSSSFSLSVKQLAQDYKKYKDNVDKFAPLLRWSKIANMHIELFSKLRPSTV
jgi:glycosyltransferase involved in cell wall biosynthesis